MKKTNLTPFQIFLRNARKFSTHKERKQYAKIDIGSQENFFLLVNCAASN